MALLKVIVLSLALWSLINASGSQGRKNGAIVRYYEKKRIFIVLNEDSCTTDSQCHENAECVHYGIVRGNLVSVPQDIITFYLILI